MLLSIRKGLRAAGVAAVLGFALPVLGQEPTPAPAPTAEGPEAAPAQGGVEEIVITSTKREENIQDVPIAVSAFTGDDLIARGIDEVEELEDISPSIQINTSSSASNGGTIRIRGMGTTGNNPGLEAAVGSFVDGVYRSRSGQTFGDLLDIERVEVLRGPQGTLFGKNTSAGAVHIITKKPVLEGMEGFVQGELGNLDHKRVAISHSAPIIEEVLGYRVSASWNDRDGFYKDIHSDAKYADRDRYALRGQLLWAPTESFEARLIADYGERDESCCPAQTVFFGPTSNRLNENGDPVPSNAFGAQELAASIGLGRDFINIPGAFVNPAGCVGAGCVGPYPFEKASRKRLDDREVGLNYAPFEDVIDWGLSLEMTYDFDWAALTSITSYRDFHAQYGQDIDFTSADILRPQEGLDDITEIWSQEIRLVGSWEKLDWLVGAYFYGEDLTSDERLEFGSQGGIFALQSAAGGALLPEGAGYSADWAQEADGYAFFTHNTFHVTDAFSITGGVRYSHEKKKAVGILNDGPLAVIDGELQPDFFAGLPVPGGVNDPFTGAAVPGNGPWCEELTAAGLGVVRTALRGFCDNASWRADATENEVTGQVSLAYAITEDVNVYTTYARGYKAGGYNLDQESVDIVTASATGLITSVVDAAHFDPEFANSYEVGIKGVYLDGRARINVAGFWTDFEDFQLNTFNGLGFIITNVDEVRSRGFELEALLAPADGVTVNFGVTYADTRYGKGIDLCFPLQFPDGNNNNCTGLGAPDNGPDAPFAEDFLADHRRITNAPAWSGNLSVYGERQLVGTEWMGYGTLGVRYNGRHNTGSNLHPLKFERHHYYVNMSLGVRSPDGHWDASVWSQNLNNEYENTIVFDSVFQGGNQGTFFNTPRTYGVTLKYNFF
jgi:outer membrane receptor protein involved in Fe transport